MEITQKEIDQALHTNDTSDLRRMMENIEKQKDFKVGDVLVLKDTTDNSLQKVGSVIKKWIVVYIDEFNIVYVKLILQSAKLSKRVTCIATSWPWAQEYEIDPEVITSILLEDDSYDPTADAQNMIEKKKNLKSINEKRRLKKKERTKLRKGDSIWTSHNIYGEYKEKWTITFIGKTHMTISFGTHLRDIDFDHMSTNTYKEEPITLEDI